MALALLDTLKLEQPFDDDADAVACQLAIPLANCPYKSRWSRLCKEKGHELKSIDAIATLLHLLPQLVWSN